MTMDDGGQQTDRQTDGQRERGCVSLMIVSQAQSVDLSRVVRDKSTKVIECAGPAIQLLGQLSVMNRTDVPVAMITIPGTKRLGQHSANGTWYLD